MTLYEFITQGEKTKIQQRGTTVTNMKSIVTDKGTRTIRKFGDVGVCISLTVVEHGPRSDAIYDNVFVLLYELKSLQEQSEYTLGNGVNR